MTELQVSTAEKMAIAVLRGDFDEARMLADMLLLDCEGGLRPITPVRRSFTEGRIKAIVYYSEAVLKGELSVDYRRMEQGIRAWMTNGNADSIQTVGVDRIEFYQFPPEK